MDGTRELELKDGAGSSTRWRNDEITRTKGMYGIIYME